MSHVLLGLLALLASNDARPPVVVAGGGIGERAVVIPMADEDESPAGATDSTPAARRNRRVIIRKSVSDEEPPVWLGLRVTELPAPLAAHIGPAGVMIANIVRRSPADQAELEQYDVILKVDQQAIEKPDDLLAALRHAKAGQKLRLTVLRKGTQREVDITPVERPRDGDLELKYEEPEDALINDAWFLRGRTLRRDPDGRWIIEELGPLSGFNDLLKHLRRFEFGGPDFGGPDDLPVFRDVPRPDTEREAQVEVQIQVELNGQHVSIRRLPDGKIEVTRRDRDGHESTATYENAEVLREADPTLYRLYRRHAPELADDDHWGLLRSRGGDRLRKEVQVEIRSKLLDALSRAKDALKEAERQSADAARKYLEAWERAGRQAERDRDTETLLVQVRDDGSISVEYARNGRREKYEFKSRADFEAGQPELYAQVKELLD